MAENKRGDFPPLPPLPRGHFQNGLWVEDPPERATGEGPVTRDRSWDWPQDIARVRRAKRREAFEADTKAMPVAVVLITLVIALGALAGVLASNDRESDSARYGNVYRQPISEVERWQVGVQGQ